MCEKGALERDIAECETRIAAAVGGVFTRLQNLYKKRAAITQGEGGEPVGDEPCPRCGTYGWGSDHASDCPNNPVPGHGTGTLDEIASLPPFPAGNADPRVREALERMRENCAAWCDTNGFPVAGECLRKLPLSENLPSPQSQGLVEAAEPWSPQETAQALAKSARETNAGHFVWSEGELTRNIESFINECVRRSRTPDRSAK